METRLKLLKMFEAIESDDHLSVRKILANNIAPESKIPSRHLCGLAIIAAENNAVKVAKEFFKYNTSAKDSDLNTYLTIAQRIFDEKKNDFKVVLSELVH